jgi:glycerol kinase
VPSLTPDREVIVSIDQGTTNTKAVLVDRAGRVVASGSAPVGVASPAPGWVEQSAEAIWRSVLAAVAAADIDRRYTTVGVALSTQRESVVGWDAATGRPLGPVIGWQDRRTAPWCADTIDEAARAVVRQRTGLQVDAMFSAPKMRWLLDHLPAGVADADVRLGTVDSWLLWNLTAGAAHRGEAGNASRTLLYDVVELQWSPDLLDIFGVPLQALPQVEASNGSFGVTAGVAGLPDGVPILSVMADSHAALFGQGCTTPGTAKATYGTGSSVMTPVNGFVAGTSAVPTTLAWVTDRPTYAREGNILSTGAALAWTADILTAGRVADLMALAETVSDSGGVTLVPAFSGLGAPHWDREATALFSGMTASTSAAHLARAAIDAVAHQVADVVEAIELDGERLAVLRADGGITVSDLAMQTQADLLGRDIEVADVPEVSALGAAQLGWLTLDPTLDWTADRAAPRAFHPSLDDPERRRRRDRWAAEVERSRLRPTADQEARP